ncbi:MAG: thioredoxin-like domain-containing protein [Bacteroidales bacterium]|nr:thioredoxin-like domain-containing protein [Bacteroidales bacterium]
MFRRTIISLLIFISAGVGVIVAQDTTAGHQYAHVTEYFDSLTYQPVDTVIARINELIAATDDPNTQSMIAGLAFDYYYRSPIMGQEAVAVYIADNYFLNKKLKWSDDNSYPLLFTFAEFNRASLIGMEAQDLIISDIDSNNVSLKACGGEYKIMYFYDARCATCKEQTDQLCEILKRYSGPPVTLLAVYTQSDREEWMDYVNAHFATIDNPAVKVVNLWDPEGESLYHKKFAVLSTPSMLLLDRDNIIIGRKLNCEALAQLLVARNEFREECLKLFNTLFDSEEGMTDAEMARIVDLLYAKTKNDRNLFKDTFYELYGYLDSHPGYEFRKGALYVAQIYILDKAELWSETMLDEAEYAVEMFGKNMVGSKATDLVLQNRCGKDKSILSYKSDYTILYFHLVQCEDCQKFTSEIKEISKTLKKKGIKLIAIYVGRDEVIWKDFIKDNEKKWVYLWDKNNDSLMHQKYDIRYVPKIYLLDNENTVIANDIDATTLIDLINKL